MKIEKPLLSTIVDFFWGIGLTLTLINLLSFYLPEGKSRNWLDYIIVGGSTGIFIGIAMAERLCELYRTQPQRHFFDRLLPVKKTLALYGTAVIILYSVSIFYTVLYRVVSSYNFTLLCIFVSAIFFLYKQIKVIEPYFLSGLKGFKYEAAIVILSVLFVLSFIALPLSHGRFSMSEIDKEYPVILPIITLCLFCFCAYISSVILKKNTWIKTSEIKDKIWNCMLQAIAFGILFVTCFRTEKFDKFIHIEHWKAIIEPSVSMRSGGWLLWDTPSQYGYLLNIILAIIPTSDLWHSLYFLNSGLLTLSGFAIFALLYARHKSMAGYFMSLLIALTSVSLLQFSSLGDFRTYPSGGIIRFLFIYLLSGYALLLWHLNSRRHVFSASPFAYILGSILWLCGVFWSAESALYSTLIWFPIAFFIALARLSKRDSQIKSLCFTVIKILLGHLILLAAILSAVILYYLHYLGIIPDIKLFTAYLTSYTALEAEVTQVGIYRVDYALPVNYAGGIISLLIVFFACCALLRDYIKRCKIEADDIYNLAVLYACIAAMFLSGSYFVSRSHEQNILNITPIFVYCISIIIFIMPKLKLSEQLSRGYVLLIACFFTAILTTSLFGKLPQNFAIEDIAKISKVENPDLKKLMNKAGITDGSSVMVIDDEYETNTQFTLRPWLLPNTSVAYAFPLAPDLYRKIAERSAVRACKYGYIIERTHLTIEYYPWIRSAIEKYYKQVNSVENDKWRILKFEKTGDAPC